MSTYTSTLLITMTEKTNEFNEAWEIVRGKSGAVCLIDDIDDNVDEEIAKKGGENVESSRSRKVPEIRRRLLLGLS
jgi:hypothetical protein